MIVLLFVNGCTNTNNNETQGRTYQHSLQLPHLTLEAPGDAAQLDANDHSQAYRSSRNKTTTTTIEKPTCHASQGCQWFERYQLVHCTSDDTRHILLLMVPGRFVCTPLPSL